MQSLKQGFALIDVSEFRRLVEQQGFHLVKEERRSAAGGKGLWLGIFARSGFDNHSLAVVARIL
jgi:hypothetical protein